MNRLHDITETYIRHLGLKRIKGDGADPILPFFMLDVMKRDGLEVLDVTRQGEWVSITARKKA